MKHEPGLNEDAKNLSLVTGSALLAVLVTVGLLTAQLTKGPEPVRVVIEARHAPEPVVDLEPEPEIAEEPVIVEEVRGTPLNGLDRIYGEVHTRWGDRFTGFIRWDRNEGTWTDLLEARKGHALSGIRFGHVDRIQSLGRSSAMFTLRSGERVELQGNATDLGSGLRALIVDDPSGRVAEMKWDDLDVVNFMPAPEDARPSEFRIYGTVTTRTGLEFTGYVTWDVDEIYSTDVLDGDDERGRRQKIPFGSIHTIERFGSNAARVVLTSGEEMVLDGTNDVNSSNSGISVSDPALGQVKFGWDEFDRVVFHGGEEAMRTVEFDGGQPIRGTVVTMNGDEYEGEIVWDDDEAYTWEMLNGDMRGLEFQIEFGEISKIERTRRGAEVTLRDGRTFSLSGSNDVDNGNDGVQVRTDGRTYRIDWDDFRELRISN